MRNRGPNPGVRRRWRKFEVRLGWGGQWVVIGSYKDFLVARKVSALARGIKTQGRLQHCKRPAEVRQIVLNWARLLGYVSS